MAENTDIRRDPHGRPACTARKRMTWSLIIAGIAISAGSVALGGDAAVREAGVWAGVALAIAGLAAYFVGRAALERVLAGLTKQIG